MSFTWYNINAGRQNQLIRFSSDNGKTFSDIAFPAGVWEYKGMNEFIQKATVVKQAGQDDIFPINLSFSPTTFRVTITLATNYQLDLTQSNFYDLIGFDKKILKDEVNLGPRVPNLSQDTDMLKRTLRSDKLFACGWGRKRYHLFLFNICVGTIIQFYIGIHESNIQPCE